MMCIASRGRLIGVTAGAATPVVPVRGDPVVGPDAGQHQFEQHRVLDGGQRRVAELLQFGEEGLVVLGLRLLALAAVRGLRAGDEDPERLHAVLGVQAQRDLMGDHRAHAVPEQRQRHVRHLPQGLGDLVGHGMDGLGERLADPVLPARVAGRQDVDVRGQGAGP